MPNVGAELASVPFGKMIYDMASAIARSQIALDRSSIELVKVLSTTKFDYLPDVVEILEPAPRVLQYTDADGNLQTVTDSDGQPVMITGVQVNVSPGETFPLTLLQAGVNPTFYQFTNSVIQIKMSVTSTTESDDSLNVAVDTQGNRDFLFSGGTVTTHVNASFANKFSYSVDGSSSLQTTLACVPPPKAMMPRFILVNAMNPKSISISQS
jgi:hypothetical protein